MFSVNAPSRRHVVSHALLLASAVSGCATAAPGSQSGGAADELAVIDAYFAAYRAMDAPALLALCAEDIYFEDPTFHLRAANREEMRQIIEPAAASFSNVSFTPFNRIHASPWVIVQQRLGGVLRRQDGQIRTVEVQGLSMFQIRDGLIAKWYDYYDVLSFREQVRGEG